MKGYEILSNINGDTKAKNIVSRRPIMSAGPTNGIRAETPEIKIRSC